MANSNSTGASGRTGSSRSLRATRTRRGIALASLAAFALGAPAATAENIRIAGSDSMVPMLQALTSALAQRDPELRVSIQGHGSVSGPPALLRGSADLAAMTRPMNEVELAAFQAKFHRPPRRFAIANDAVAIFASAQSPIDELTLLQVDAIFSRDRRCGSGDPIRTWGDLGASGPWSTRQIGVYVTPISSGTRGFFELIALCRGKVRRDAREQPGTGSIVHALQQSQYGIGYGSRSALAPGIKRIRLAPRSEPGSMSQRSGDAALPDPLARKLLLYERPRYRTPLALSKSRLETLEAQSRGVRRFLTFALSDAGQEIVISHGFGRIDDPLRREQLATLE